MGFRFRKSVKLVPGVRLNFSNSGTSVSVGGRGYTKTFSKKGTRTTVSIPGTGISYTETNSNRQRAAQAEPASAAKGTVWWLLLTLFALFVVMQLFF